MVQECAALAERYPVATAAWDECGPLGGPLVLVVIYLPGMPRAAEAGRYGEVFNEVADEYHRHRPAYPDTLIDQACEVGGLGPGATVLEIGCGTGQGSRIPRPLKDHDH